VPFVQAQIEIAADPAQVWALLSDLAGYPRWNPSIAQLDGQLISGARLRLRARFPGGLRVTVRPKLAPVETAHQLSWIAALLHPKFFSAEHRFVLDRIPSGVRLTQREDFRGWIAPLFAALFARGLQQSYDDANSQLKRLVETSAALPVG
jgi:hypothetical protein